MSFFKNEVYTVWCGYSGIMYAGVPHPPSHEKTILKKDKNGFPTKIREFCPKYNVYKIFKV